MTSEVLTIKSRGPKGLRYLDPTRYWEDELEKAKLLTTLAIDYFEAKVRKGDLIYEDKLREIRESICEEN